MISRCLLVSLVASCSAFTVLPPRPAVASVRRLRGGSPVAMAQPGVAIIVDAEIEPDRVEEFIKVIEADAKGSREEPGCLRFDVLRASDTRFFFYEVRAQDCRAPPRSPMTKPFPLRSPEWVTRFDDFNSCPTPRSVHPAPSTCNNNNMSTCA